MSSLMQLVGTFLINPTLSKCLGTCQQLPLEFLECIKSGFNILKNHFVWSGCSLPSSSFCCLPSKTKLLIVGGCCETRTN